MQNQHHSKFTVRNESFICCHCALEVKPLRKGCRNHCPKCFHSLHVDIFPGDRLNACQGLLKPIRYEYLGRNGVDIVFKCQKCHQESKNKATLDDPNQADDFEELLKLNKIGF